MTTVAQLTIEMAANVARLQKDMAQINSTVDGAMAKVRKSAQLAANALVSIGAGLSVAAISSFIRNAVNAADSLDELSQKVGVSVEDLSGLQLAFKFGGVEAGVLQASMVKLANAAVENSKAFKTLGIDAQNVDGSFKNTRQLLGEVADKFQDLDNGAQKTALAVDIFGKSGADLIPLLNGGSESLDQFDQAAQNLGLTISSETAAQAAQFNDTMDLMGEGIRGIGLQVAADLLPTMQNLAGGFLEAFTQGDRLKGLSGVLAGAMKVIASAVIVVVDIFRMAIRSIGSFADAISAISEGRFRDAASAIGDAFSGNIDLLKESVASIKTVWSETAGESVRSIGSIRTATTNLTTDTKTAEKQAKKIKEAEKERLKLYKELQKATEDFRKEQEAVVDIESKTAEEIQKQVAELRDQTEAYGQNEKGLRRLELAKIDDQIATVEMRIAMAEFGAANRDLIPVYQAQVQALRDLKLAKEGYYDKKAVVDQATTVQESFNKIFDDISTGLTDALVRGFENGKSIGDSFFDYIKNYAKSLVVKIPVQYIKSGLGGLFGMAGSGAANASEMGGFGGFGGLGGSGSSLLSDPVGTIKSVYSAFTEGSSFLTANTAAEFSSVISDFGFELATQGGFLQDFGTSVFNNAETLGQLGQAAGVAFTALSAFDALKDGRYATAIGTGIGYALGGPLGATLGNFAGSLVDKVLGFGGGGGRNAFGTFDTTTGVNVGTEDRFRHEADLDGSVATFGQAFEAQYRQIVETLGGLPGDIATYIRVKTDVGGDSPSDAYFTSYIDGKLVASLGRGGIGRSSEELQAALEDYAKRNLVAALANSNIDGEFRSLFSSVNVATASIKELEAVLETAQTLMQAQARFTAMFGTETEKLALAQKNLNTQFLRLGEQMPSSIDEFKALILAQDRTTDSGRNTYLGLLALAEQFAQVASAQQQLQAAFENTKFKTQQYLAVLGGQTQTTLQQVTNQMVALNNQLASTTDPSQRLALESQLSDLIFQRYQAEVEMLGAVLAKTQELFANIQAESVLVSNARATISGTGPGVMTVAQIRAEIAQASALGALPAAAGLESANQVLASLQSQSGAQQSLIENLIGQRSGLSSGLAVKQQDLTAQLELARAAVAAFNSNNSVGSAFATNSGGGLAIAGFDEKAMRAAVDYAYITYSVGREADVTALRSAINTQLRDELGGKTIADALFGANNRIAQAQQGLTTVSDQLAAKTIELAQAQARATELQKAMRQAELDRVKAQEAFAESISQYVIDAGKAVSRLSRLREETVKYYEAQDRLAQLMGSSASGLRGTVDSIRFGDMNAVQQLQSLQGDFAQAFASAQSASGESLAGYGTSLNSLIDPILQKAAEVYASGPQFQAIKEAILSQALTVADRLESLQPKDYQMESLGLLDTIDTTLELIEANTKSAEALIVAAINESKLATTTRLEAVLAAIQGNPIPGFAKGGVFGGGVRMVGERGPEIELTGASRIIPNNRIGDMLRPVDTRGIEERLDMIARDTAAQVRVLSAGMMQQSKQIDQLIDENRTLRKKLSLEAVK